MKWPLFFAYMVASYVVGTWIGDTSDSIWLYALITAPGTFFHESMHWLTAAALHGNPGSMHLIPSGDALGYVAVEPNWYNAATIGAAPLVLAPFAGLFLGLATSAGFSWKAPLYLYLACCSWAACIPSGADWEIARSSAISWPIALVILGSLTALIIWLLMRCVGTQDTKH